MATIMAFLAALLVGLAAAARPDVAARAALMDAGAAQVRAQHAVSSGSSHPSAVPAAGRSRRAAHDTRRAASRTHAPRRLPGARPPPPRMIASAPPAAPQVQAPALPAAWGLAYEMQYELEMPYFLQLQPGGFRWAS